MGDKILRVAFWIVGWLTVGLAGAALLWVIGSVLDNEVVETVLSSLVASAVVASIVRRVVSAEYEPDEHDGHPGQRKSV